jgi:hypothetical protein
MQENPTVVKIPLSKKVKKSKKKLPILPIYFEDWSLPCGSKTEATSPISILQDEIILSTTNLGT